MWNDIAFSFQQGNPYLASIFGLAFVACVVILERLMMYLLVYNINYRKFIGELRKMLLSKDYERAVTLCTKTSNHALPRIALRAIETVEDDPTRVRASIEENTLEVLPLIEKRVAFLPGVVAVIMLAGVLGTIIELWDVFHSIRILDTIQKQASLAMGIADALQPTIFALLASIVIMLFHQILKSIALTLLDKINLGVAVLNNLLVPDVSFIATGPSQGASPPAQESEKSEVTIEDEEPEAEEEGGLDADAVEDIKDEEEII